MLLAVLRYVCCVVVLQCWYEACLTDFDGFVADDMSAVHHPKTLHLLAAGGPLPLRAAVEAFAKGEPMSAELSFEVGKLALIPVVERSIEAKHALISRRVQKRHRSGRVLSLILRVPDVKESLRRDAGFAAKLVDCFSAARSPYTAAERLGLSCNPAMVVARRVRMKSNRVFAILNRIVYRCDLESKFDDHGASRAQHAREAARNARAGLRQLGRPHQLPEPVTQDRVFRSALFDHFRHVADPTKFYSMPLLPNEETGQVALPCGLDTVFAEPAAKRLRVATGLSLAADIDGDGCDVAADRSGFSGEHPGRYTIHFRVVHAKPSLMHTVRVPLAAGRRLSSDHVAITVHEALGTAAGDCDKTATVNLKPKRMGQTAVAALPGFSGLNSTYVAEHLLMWSPSPAGMEYTIQGFTGSDASSTADVVTQLVKAGAFDGSGKHMQVPRAMFGTLVWQDLLSADYVQERDPPADGDSVNCCLTGVAASNLVVGVRLVSPQPVSNVRYHIAVEDLTAYELIMKLTADGWSWKELPKLRSQRVLLTYQPGDDCVWYSGAVPSTLYLRCLLMAEKLHAKGLTPIPHWAQNPAASWGQLLRGLAFRPRAAAGALKPDVDDDGFAATAAHGADTHELAPDPGDTAFDLEASLEEIVEAEAAAASESEGWEKVPESPINVGGGSNHDDDEAPLTSLMRRHCPNDDVAPAAPDPDSEPEPLLRHPWRPGEIMLWGCFRISHLVATKNRPHGAFEARCPWHRKNNRSGCKKYARLYNNDPEHVASVLLALKWWCVQANTVSRQSHHVGIPVDVATCPVEHIVDAGFISEPPVEPPPADDDVDGIMPPAAARPTGHGRGGGRNRGRGRGRGAAAAADVAAPEDTGSSSSSPSSSASRSSCEGVAAAGCSCSGGGSSSSTLSSRSSSSDS